MTQSTSLDLLREWRLKWTVDELEWRTVDWAARRDNREEEVAQRRKERARKDRRFFGVEEWGASPKHSKATTDESLLRKRGLPVFDDESSLASWLEIPLSRLRWYTYGKAASRVWHYVRYVAKKRSGGERIILAPKRQLKALQRKVLHGILEKLPMTAAAHGFVRERSIVTNARPHVGHKFVLNLDLKDFFPSIHYPRVRGLFVKVGYSFAVASALAMLCTETDREPLKRGEKTFYVSVGPRTLIQGAPTSPMLANLLARRLDARLAGWAAKHQLQYTRYADDLTFSGDDYDTLLRTLDVAQRIITSEGFAVNAKKTRLYRQSGRQVVTGLVVNDKVNTPREMRRTLRAILHHAAQTGLATQNRDGRENFRAYLQGLIGHLAQADPDTAKRFTEQLNALKD